MKKLICMLLCLAVIVTFGLFALASSSSDNQGSGTADAGNQSNLGDYQVEILSCRLAKSYDSKPVVIVKYLFQNNSDEPASFYVQFDDAVYQAGVGLNPAYVLQDSANYSADNQTKDIKPGAQLEVEVAYELNDETTDIEVEVSQLFSFDDSVVTKTFTIAQ